MTECVGQKFCFISETTGNYFQPELVFLIVYFFLAVLSEEQKQM